MIGGPDCTLAVRQAAAATRDTPMRILANRLDTVVSLLCLKETCRRQSSTSTTATTVTTSKPLGRRVRRVVVFVPGFVRPDLTAEKLGPSDTSLGGALIQKPSPGGKCAPFRRPGAR